MVKEKAMKHGVRLSLDVATVPNTITADDRKIKQILYNLLSNAVKFTPVGGSVHLAATETGLNGTNQQALKISVEDTGAGIDAEHLQRIFDPFEQASGSESVPFEGTGLGLSITKRLVELHGGEIWAESAGKDKGSVFHVVIPS
jgi:signal transduction histidine kinase